MNAYWVHTDYFKDACRLLWSQIIPFKALVNYEDILPLTYKFPWSRISYILIHVTMPKMTLDGTVYKAFTMNVQQKEGISEKKYLKSL
jgi:hypothetical protein